MTLTIDSPLRITRPSVRFCWTEGAASVGLASFVFFPYPISSYVFKRVKRTHLDGPELFTFGKNKIHVFVISQHLTD